MANRKYNYQMMEDEYIASDDLSVRELARRNGIDNHSVLHEYARRHQWADKRKIRQARTEQKKLERLGDRVAARQDRLEVAFDESVELIIEAIQKTRRDLRETPDKVNVAPKDLVLLIDRLLAMRGQPSQITEERNLGLSLSGPVRGDQLAAILELTRGVAAADGSRQASSAIPRLEDTRSN